MTDLHPSRDALALALDVDSATDAVALLRRLRPWFAVGKVGLELFVAEGLDVIRAVREEGFDVFVDLKLHDIPTTVHKAATVVGGTGARFLTVHTSGGRAMLRAGVVGFEAGAAAGGHGRPVTLGVTVLTSDAEASPATFDARVEVAMASHCPGVVCSPLDVRRAKALHPGALAVCPGVRPVGTAHDDQARAATPTDAIRSGADILVIGRPVTAASRPEQAAAALAEEVAVALGSGR